MDAGAALVKVLREEGPRVLGTLVRQFGDLSVAEDALSEATIAALGAWPGSGIPDNPRAWLTVVARRKALDFLRRESARTGQGDGGVPMGNGARERRDGGGDRRDGDRKRAARRHAALDLHLLPPRSQPRGPGGLGLAHAGPPRSRCHRPSLLGARGHHGQAPGTGEIQDRHRPHPLCNSLRRGAPRSSGRGAGRGVPDRHRGPRPDRRERGGPGGSGGRGRSPGPLVGGVDARRARGAVFAGSVVVHLSSHPGA